MVLSMGDSLYQRLLNAESDFLTAFQLGGKHLASYEATWSSLQCDVESVSIRGNDNHRVVETAHIVATRIMKLAACFIDIQTIQQNWTHLLHQDMETILSGMSHIALADPTNSELPDTSSLDLDPTASGCLPKFILPAYQWLLQNTHNPYPSAPTKNAISESTGCSVPSINAWFVNARRRMGWTTICRDHFLNCRADAVDAAYRALVKEDPSRPLPPSLIHAFMVMKVNAEGLYSSAFTKSALAGDLDAVVKDMTEEDERLVEDEKRRQAEENREMLRIQRVSKREMRKNSLPQDSYPSPNRSGTSSPVPVLDDSPTDESEDEEDAPPPVVAGRKRHSSSMEPVDQPSFGMASRPLKRLRSSASVASSFGSGACLPSPPSSVDSAGDSSENDSPTLAVHATSPAPYPHTRINSTVSRKRRLSDADADGIPKRPRGPGACPRLQTVSDPLPRSNVESEYSVDEWFNTNFDALFALPPPVDATEPDFSAPWEVQLFSNYDIPQDLEKRTFTSPSLSAQDRQTSTSTDLAELESLLQSIDNCIAPPETDNLTSASFMTSLGNSASHDASFSSDLSQPIDWTTLLHSTESLEPTIDSLFPQQSHSDSPPLPGIDLCMLQLPHVTSTVSSQTTLSEDLASKQTKLNQLQALQEAVWRMQKELQSEGVAL
ncbi:hypothetical protein BDN67DRAFT_1072939 [Paxillus ammoniavirescens]|nr:hypothetical protein BDN67DRAFT_1072939 [Paxillus ammoniavirescens]